MLLTAGSVKACSASQASTLSHFHIQPRASKRFVSHWPGCDVQDNTPIVHLTEFTSGANSTPLHCITHSVVHIAKHTNNAPHASHTHTSQVLDSVGEHRVLARASLSTHNFLHPHPISLSHTHTHPHTHPQNKTHHPRSLTVLASTRC